MSLRFKMMGLATVLGLAQKGFFIPYRDAHALPRPGARAPYAILGDMLHSHETDFRTLIDGIDSFIPDLKKIGRDNPPEPRLEPGLVYPPRCGGCLYTGACRATQTYY